MAGKDKVGTGTGFKAKLQVGAKINYILLT